MESVLVCEVVVGQGGEPREREGDRLRKQRGDGGVARKDDTPKRRRRSRRPPKRTERDGVKGDDGVRRRWRCGRHRRQALLQRRHGYAFCGGGGARGRLHFKHELLSCGCRARASCKVVGGDDGWSKRGLAVDGEAVAQHTGASCAFRELKANAAEARGFYRRDRFGPFRSICAGTAAQRRRVGRRDGRESFVLPFSIPPRLFPLKRHSPGRTFTTHIKGEAPLKNGRAASLAAQNTRDIEPRFVFARLGSKTIVRLVPGLVAPCRARPGFAARDSAKAEPGPARFR